MALLKTHILVLFVDFFNIYVYINRLLTVFGNPRGSLKILIFLVSFGWISSLFLDDTDLCLRQVVIQLIVDQ